MTMATVAIGGAIIKTILNVFEIWRWVTDNYVIKLVSNEITVAIGGAMIKTILNVVEIWRWEFVLFR